MPGLQPLAAVLGQIEAVGDRRTEIPFLNIGNLNVVVANSPAITVTNSFVFLSSAGGTQQINQINGGEQGDLLFLVSGGNISMRDTFAGAANLRLAGHFNNMGFGDTMVLLFGGSTWVELTRSNN